MKTLLAGPSPTGPMKRAAEVTNSPIANIPMLEMAIQYQASFVGMQGHGGI